jgi:hypothetical protein
VWLPPPASALVFIYCLVPPRGPPAAGVMAIRLLGDDMVIGLEVVKEGSSLFVLHEGGWGKRVLLDEYSPKGRYTQGLWTTDHRRLEEIGRIVSARVVEESDQITVITSKGIVLRTSVAGISRMGRSTRGVRVVNLGKGDTVAAVAVLNAEDLDRGVDSTDEHPGGVAPGETPLGDVALGTGAQVTIDGVAVAAEATPQVAESGDLPDADASFEETSDAPQDNATGDAPDGDA